MKIEKAIYRFLGKYPELSKSVIMLNECPYSSDHHLRANKTLSSEVKKKPDRFLWGVEGFFKSLHIIFENVS